MNIMPRFMTAVIEIGEVDDLTVLSILEQESPHNPEDFPPSFVEGGAEGFYWAFVSMTTVG